MKKFLIDVLLNILSFVVVIFALLVIYSIGYYTYTLGWVYLTLYIIVVISIVKSWIDY